ncbi:MAG TPA: hypothetical protein VF624_05100 [Tepidisphaeraceae bacterium]|jgi:hypothetical protein
MIELEYYRRSRALRSNRKLPLPVVWTLRISNVAFISTVLSFVVYLVFSVAWGRDLDQITQLLPFVVLGAIPLAACFLATTFIFDVFARNTITKHLVVLLNVSALSVGLMFLAIFLK